MIEKLAYLLNNTQTPEAIKYMQLNYGNKDYYDKMKPYTKYLYNIKESNRKKEEKNRPDLDELTR